MDRINRDICARIKQARIDAGLKQSDLAALLGIGRPAYTAKENGTNRYSITEVSALSTKLGKSVEWMLTGKDGQGKEVVTDKEARLLGAFRELDEKDQNTLLMKAMDLMIASREK